MYHPAIITQRLNSMVDALRKQGIQITPTPLTVQQSAAWEAHLADAQERPLTKEEQHHIRSEMVLNKADYLYWRNRYGKIKSDGKVQTFPPKPSQVIFLNMIAELERKAFAGERRDGLLFQVLKSRQVGISTETNLLLDHRNFLYGGTLSLIGSDVRNSVMNLFGMSERVYNGMPWWMRPEKTAREKGTQLYFQGIDSEMRFEWANSVRGSKAVDDEAGQMGRGMPGIHMFHGTEISSWDNPEQIDYSILPAIHRSKNVFGVLESTPLGKENYYYKTWQRVTSGAGDRWVPVFIGWYMEQELRETITPGWEPLDITKAHAAKIEQTSPLWAGRVIRPDGEQMFWWEQNYKKAKEMRRIYKFAAEYAADPEACFSASRPSVFSEERLYDLQQTAKPELGYYDIRMLQ